MQQTHRPHRRAKSPQPSMLAAGSCSRGKRRARCSALLWAMSPKGAGCVTGAELAASARPVPPGCTSKRLSERVGLSRALPAAHCRAAMARVITILGLVALMPATAVPCRAPRLDNTTASKLLGTWLYVAGAAQFPQHLLEMLLIDHGHLHVEPGAGDRELLVTQHVAAGDQCLTNNSTYFEVAAGDATLVKHAERHQIVGTLMNLSSEDVLLIQYQPQGERTYLGLYLYARNLSASTAHREEFERRAKSLGLSEERIVYAPWKRELCQTQEVEQGNSPCTEPTAAVPAPPPPGTRRESPSQCQRPWREPSQEKSGHEQHQ
ncbi:alpha-1-acid glycoprotein 2 isoform X1 [Opisthocomus hoazin]|uniref:alpha-1-acid glycoprotein 2 isoform X1 n=1 Tax=Opisthocomus hoazin TaxID=30419 RepID=UPI003F53718E